MSGIYEGTYAQMVATTDAPVGTEFTVTSGTGVGNVYEYRGATAGWVQTHDASGAAHVSSHITNLALVTPHDTNANAYFPLWIEAAGAITMRLSGMTSGSITINVPVGWLPVETSLILSTGTTATVYGRPV